MMERTSLGLVVACDICGLFNRSHVSLICIGQLVLIFAVYDFFWLDVQLIDI